MRRRVEIILTENEPHVYPAIQNLPIELQKKFLDATKFSKRIIQFNYPQDIKIMQDRQFIDIVAESMRSNKGIVVQFQSNGWLLTKTQMDIRSKAKQMLIKNALSLEEIEYFQNILVLEIPHPKQSFTTRLFENLAEPYKWLIDNHDVTYDEALQILLDILQGWFPDVDRIQKITITAFRKALNRMR